MGRTGQSGLTSLSGLEGPHTSWWIRSGKMPLSLATFGERSEAQPKVIDIQTWSKGHSYFVIKYPYLKGMFHMGSRVLIVLKVWLLGSWVASKDFWVREGVLYLPMSPHNFHFHFGESNTTISIARHKTVGKIYYLMQVRIQAGDFPKQCLPYTKEAWDIIQRAKA